MFSAKLQRQELQKMKVFVTSFQMAFFMHLKITVTSKLDCGAHLLAYVSPHIRSPKPGSQACLKQAEIAVKGTGRLAM